MAGWASFIAIAAAALLGLWWLKFPPMLRNFALAAVMLAAAGYAWQGRPALAGQAVAPGAASLAIDDETLGLRNAMLGRFGSTAAYFTTSDALMRYGAPAAAAQFVQAGIGREPGNMALWVQLGILTAARDRAVSPAAGFTFRRAMALAPGEPAPPFFLGLAYVRSGEFDKGRAMWARALALTPANFAYRPAIAARLALLDAFLAQRDQ